MDARTALRQPASAPRCCPEELPGPCRCGPVSKKASATSTERSSLTPRQADPPPAAGLKPPPPRRERPRPNLLAPKPCGCRPGAHGELAMGHCCQTAASETVQRLLNRALHKPVHQDEGWSWELGALLLGMEVLDPGVGPPGYRAPLALEHLARRRIESLQAQEALYLHGAASGGQPSHYQYWVPSLKRTSSVRLDAAAVDAVARIGEELDRWKGIAATGCDGGVAAVGTAKTTTHFARKSPDSGGSDRARRTQDRPFTSRTPCLGLNRTWYVAAGAVGRRDGLSPQTAFSDLTPFTIWPPILRPGDTVTIAGGTYNNVVMSNGELTFTSLYILLPQSSRPGQCPVTFRSKPGDEVIFELGMGPAVAADNPILLFHSQAGSLDKDSVQTEVPLILQDLKFIATGTFTSGGKEVKGRCKNLLQIAKVSEVTLRSCSVGGLNDWIDGLSEQYNNPSGPSWYNASIHDAKRGLVQGCVFDCLTGPAPDLKNPPNSEGLLLGGCSGLVIEQNYFGAAGHWSLNINNSEGIVVRGNVFRNPLHSAVQIIYRGGCEFTGNLIAGVGAQTHKDTYPVHASLGMAVWSSDNIVAFNVIHGDADAPAKGYVQDDGIALRVAKQQTAMPTMDDLNMPLYHDFETCTQTWVLTFPKGWKAGDEPPKWEWKGVTFTGEVPVQYVKRCIPIEWLQNYQHLPDMKNKTWPELAAAAQQLAEACQVPTEPAIEWPKVAGTVLKVTLDAGKSNVVQRTVSLDGKQKTLADLMKEPFKMPNGFGVVPAEEPTCQPGSTAGYKPGCGMPGAPSKLGIGCQHNMGGTKLCPDWGFADLCKTKGTTLAWVRADLTPGGVLDAGRPYQAAFERKASQMTVEDLNLIFKGNIPPLTIGLRVTDTYKPSGGKPGLHRAPDMLSPYEQYHELVSNPAYPVARGNAIFNNLILDMGRTGLSVTQGSSDNSDSLRPDVQDSLIFNNIIFGQRSDPTQNFNRWFQGSVGAKTVTELPFEGDPGEPKFTDDSYALLDLRWPMMLQNPAGNQVFENMVGRRPSDPLTLALPEHVKWWQGPGGSKSTGGEWFLQVLQAVSTEWFKGFGQKRLREETGEWVDFLKGLGLESKNKGVTSAVLAGGFFAEIGFEKGVDLFRKATPEEAQQKIVPTPYTLTDAAFSAYLWASTGAPWWLTLKFDIATHGVEAGKVDPRTDWAVRLQSPYPSPMNYSWATVAEINDESIGWGNCGAAGLELGPVYPLAKPMFTPQPQPNAAPAAAPPFPWTPFAAAVPAATLASAPITSNIVPLRIVEYLATAHDFAGKPVPKVNGNTVVILTKKGPLT